MQTRDQPTQSQATHPSQPRWTLYLVIGELGLAAGLQLVKWRQPLGFLDHDQTFQQKADFVVLDKKAKLEMWFFAFWQSEELICSSTVRSRKVQAYNQPYTRENKNYDKAVIKPRSSCSLVLLSQRSTRQTKAGKETGSSTSSWSSSCVIGEPRMFWSISVWSRPLVNGKAMARKQWSKTPRLHLAKVFISNSEKKLKQKRIELGAILVGSRYFLN